MLINVLYSNNWVFFYHFKWELCHLVLIIYYISPSANHAFNFIFFKIMMYIYLQNASKICVIVWCYNFVNLTSFLMCHNDVYICVHVQWMVRLETMHMMLMLFWPSIFQSLHKKWWPQLGFGKKWKIQHHLNQFQNQTNFYFYSCEI